MTPRYTKGGGSKNVFRSLPSLNCIPPHLLNNGAAAAAAAAAAASALQSALCNTFSAGYVMPITDCLLAHV